MRVNRGFQFTFCLFLIPILTVFAHDARRTPELLETKSAILSYPDTVEGLRDFLQTFVEAIKNADLEERSRLEESLRIPEPQKWFTSNYGPQVGRKMANNYISLPPNLYSYVDSCDLGPSLEIMVSRVEFPDEQTAKLSGIPIYRRMKHPVPFYTAYLTSQQNHRLCIVYPLFIYEQHAFRAINRDFGKIDEHNRSRCGVDHLHLHSYEMDGAIMKERLVHPTSRLPLPHDSPSDTAKTVLLLAWVNCDGSVLETDYLSGPPELFKPAHDAVEKWKYHPIVNNGAPMEVSTTVIVVFGPGE
jgi:hypothetical protein